MKPCLSSLAYDQIKKSPSPRRVYKYYRADYHGFKREFQEFAGNIREQTSELDIQTIWTSFKTTIHMLMEKYIPHKTVRGDRKPKPWITRTIKALHRKRNKLFRKQRSTRKIKDVENYKKIKSKIQRAERQAYWQHVEKVIDLGGSDIEDKPGKQKRFWSFIKSLIKDNSGVAPLKDKGKMHADPVDKSNILIRQYESVYTREDDGGTPCLDGQLYPSMPDIKVTKEGVEELQRDLDSLAQWESTRGMSFHPDKCSVLRLTKKRTQINSTYKLKGQALEELCTSKYLGVDLSSNLEWKEHIDRTVKKANSVLGFLRRNLRINNVDTKSSTYITLVRPHSEYCTSIWSPHTDKYSHKLEIVQRRAARYCTNRYHNTSSFTDMLQDLNWEKNQTAACNDVQDHQRPSGHTLRCLFDTSYIPN